VFGYLQEDMSKIKSESECAIGSDYTVGEAICSTTKTNKRRPKESV